VNSASDPCRTSHEWLVFPLCGSTGLFADAKISTLRAHAAASPIAASAAKPAAVHRASSGERLIYRGFGVAPLSLRDMRHI